MTENTTDQDQLGFTQTTLNFKNCKPKPDFRPAADVTYKVL